MHRARRDLHDRAAAGLGHVPRGCLRDEERTAQVGRLRGVPVGGRDIEEGLALREPGVADNRVEAAERCDGRSHEVRRGGGV